MREQPALEIAFIVKTFNSIHAAVVKPIAFTNGTRFLRHPKDDR
jgi:hypothetical protein